MSRSPVLVFLVLICLKALLADLPVHCLTRQVLGSWDFKYSLPTSSYPASCSHTQPDSIHSMLKEKPSFEDPKFPVDDTGTFTLLNNATALLCFSNKECEPASWTMIYDEYVFIRGLESHLELLFMFKYLPHNQQDWISYCGETYIGWISSLVTHLHGCAIAKSQVEVLPQSVSFPEMSPFGIQLRNQLRNQKSISSSTVKTLRQTLLNQLSVLEHVREKQQSTKKSTWRANATYFLQHRFEVEARRNKYFGTPLSNSLNRIPEGEARNRELLRRSCIRKVLPSQTDFAFLSPSVVDQGFCGSCYAVSSMDAFEMRIRLKLGQENFTAQDGNQGLAQCSVESQGCQGGLPWLMGRFARYVGVPSDECVGCSLSCKRVFARNWGYVGNNALGNSNAEDMMWTLARDGPITVGINAEESFFYYQSGVLVEETDASPTESRYEPSTHAVVVVGYGMKEGKETWKLKNSWGSHWGENGYFYIPRGVNAFAVESLAVHAVFGNDTLPANKAFERDVRVKLARLPICQSVIEEMFAKEMN